MLKEKHLKQLGVEIMAVIDPAEDYRNKLINEQEIDHNQWAPRRKWCFSITLSHLLSFLIPNATIKFL